MGVGGSVFSPLAGLALNRSEAPMRSDELATLTRPIFVECLAAFGSGRIMLESNFPIDRRDCGYTRFRDFGAAACAG